MADDKERAQIQLILKTVHGARAYPPDWAEDDNTWEYLYIEDTLVFRQVDEPLVREAFTAAVSRIVVRRPGIDDDTHVRETSAAIAPAWAPDWPDDRAVPGLARVSYSALRVPGDRLTVPFVLQEMDRYVAERAGDPEARVPADPDTIAFAVGYGCPASEPLELPPGICCPSPLMPPPQCDCHPSDGSGNPVCDGNGVQVAILDTGFNAMAAAGHAWLNGVGGDPETANLVIGYCEGHGTFSAGVLRTVAPAAQVTIHQALDHSGHARVSDVARTLDRVLGQQPGPQVVLVCFVTMNRHNREPIALRHVLDTTSATVSDIAFVAPAGNDGIDRDAPNTAAVWPAEMPEFFTVGALDASWRVPAGFSNRGAFVDIYTPGEHLVNAFPRGTYICQEPVVGEERTFFGMADWSGTSFAAPMLAGAIAGRLSAHGGTAHQAADDVVTRARRLPYGATTLRAYWPGDTCCPPGP